MQREQGSEAKVHEPQYVLVESDVTPIDRVSSKKAGAVSLGQKMEYLAKKGVYKLATPTSQDVDAESAERMRLLRANYTVHPLLKDMEDKGAYIYAAINSDDPNEPVMILCRGTCLDSSVIADLDPKGPGFSLVDDFRSDLVTRLNELLTDHKNVIIAGHSLGGSFAQLLTNILLEEKASATDSPISQMESLSLAIYQSAGVNQEVVDQCAASLATIKEVTPDFHCSLVSHVHALDPLPLIGNIIFGEVPSTHADVVLIKRVAEASIISGGMEALRTLTTPYLGHIQNFYSSKKTAGTEQFGSGYVDGKKCQKLQLLCNTEDGSQEEIARMFSGLKPDGKISEVQALVHNAGKLLPKGVVDSAFSLPGNIKKVGKAVSLGCAAILSGFGTPVAVVAGLVAIEPGIFPELAENLLSVVHAVPSALPSSDGGGSAASRKQNGPDSL